MKPILHRLPELVLGLLVVAALAWVLARNPAIEKRGIVQERLDAPGQPLTPEHILGQTFFSRHAGLKAVELLLVAYDPSRPPPPSRYLILTLERTDMPASSPVRSQVEALGLQHNQRVRFDFAPLPDSRNAAYRLTVRSDGDYGLSLWHTSSDAYAYGEMLENGAPQAGDLWFTAYYDYRLTEVLRDAGRLAARYGRFLPALLALFVLPGLALVLWFKPWPQALVGSASDAPDLGLALALVVALSVAVWPVLLLWASLVGLSLARGGVWVVVAVFGGLGAYRIWKERGRWAARLRALLPRDPLPEIALGAVLMLAIGTRLLQVRELVVPAWVDSVHHTLITQLIMEQGRVPASFEPYISVPDFHYHFGLHANAAAFAWLGGLPAHQAVLLLGQVFNAAAALAAYALASAFTRRRWAGVGAALVVGALSFLPAYFVSWGRYTQLTGLLLLPAACLVTAWQLGAPSSRRGELFLAGLLLAGMALTHYRVLVFYALFWLCYPALALWRARGAKVAWIGLVERGAALGGLALALASPWAARLLLRIVPRVDVLYGGWDASAGYNAFPSFLLDVGWMRQLLYAAAVGAAWALLRNKGEMIVLSAWVELWFLAANLHVLGLFDLWLVHNESVVISLWLPVSVLCGWLVADLVSWALDRARSWGWPDAQRWASLALLGATLALGAWGSWRMVDIINPITVFTTEDDLRAMRWAAENTSPDAHFLINTRAWNGEVRAGSDGGWWLPIIARRQVTLPSVFYVLGPPAYRDGVLDLARTVEQAAALDDPALVRRLAQEGVTHVFVGAAGGRLTPKELDASPHYRLRYASGPTRIYEFVANP